MAKRLLFYDPGHFHAALVLAARNPRIDRDIHVYAPMGTELLNFVDLVNGFNSRADTATDWQLHLHTEADPLGRLISERRGEIVVIAGRNNTKLRDIRRLHAAGFNVLADKPWATSSTQLPDLDLVTAGPPVAMDIMTERHDTVAQMRHRVVATKSVFGGFASRATAGPAMEFRSVHHLCKDVDGRPLTRPEWFYDVNVQGDGLVDIQCHMVDQVQWLLDAAGVLPGGSGADDGAPRIVDTRRWATPVPLSAFTESTGASSFPPELDGQVSDGVLLLACNGQIDYEMRGIGLRQRAEWQLRSQPGGGDTHWSIVRGTNAHVVVRGDPAAFDTTQIHVGSDDRQRLARHLHEALDEWRTEFPGLDIADSEIGYELLIPAELHARHEAHFPPVLERFIDLVEDPNWSAQLAGEIRDRYTLLARAQGRA